MDEMRYGALYIRVSTDKQEELSPDAQKRLLLDYAKAHNIFISPEYIFVENGISGRKADKRPEFQKMISIAKADEPPFSLILVWKFSRFARNQEESIVYKSMLKKQHGVDVVSITEPLIDGPFGGLIERIIEWMDEYYSINLSQEVKRGMTEKAMRGGYQATPSLGYASPAPGQPFVVVPEEAEIVKYIFDQYVNHNKGMGAIARKLNEKKLLTKRGNRFERRNVNIILRNRFYVGKVVWSGIERDGVHETFISQELFKAANDRLDATYRPKNRRELSGCVHWLSGLVRCSICGASLAYSRSQKYPYFNCWKYAKGMHDGSNTINERQLEKGVLEYFEQLLGGADFSFSYRVPENMSELPDKKSVFEKELEKIDQRQHRIREAYEAGIDSLDEYRENKKRLEAEAARIADLIRESEAKKVDSDPEQHKAEMLEKIRTVYDIIKSDSIDYETKGSFMRSIVEKIVWDRKSNTLTFYLYCSDSSEG